MNGPPPKLVFVVDNDFGELALVMFFIYGLPLAERATLLLPPRLCSRVGSLGAEVRPYATAADVAAIVEQLQPDIVFLFSGYLLPLQGLITAPALQELIRRWRTEGRRVVTSDPFWGLMRSPEALYGAHFLQQARFRLLGLAQYLVARRSHALKTLSATAAVLDGVQHLIPVPYAHPPVPTVPYFNPRLFDLPRDTPPVRRDAAGAGSRSYWLFILAAEDYRQQVARHDRARVPFGRPAGGRERFAEILVARLTAAIAADRSAILLAPGDCIAAVQSRLGGDHPGVTLHAFCAYRDFVSLLMGAEYAFYWNAISSSSLMRIVNDLPVFYFDRGHVGAGLAPVFDKTVQSLYQGWQPPCLGDEQLTPARLETHAQAFRQAAVLIRQNLLRAPTPDEAVALILRGTASPTVAPSCEVSVR